MFRSVGPGTMLSPVPAVMVSCALPGEKPNIITIAWAGTVCSKPPMLSVSIRKDRFSYDIIAKSGEFVVNLVGTEQAQAADFCGVKSGRDVDKFAELSLTPVAAPPLTVAPAIAQCPAALPCRVKGIIQLGSHDLFLAEIQDVMINDRFLLPDGKVDMEAMHLVAYSHGQYCPLESPMGFFGYAVARDDVKKRRMGK